MNPIPSHPILIPDRILRGMGVSFLKDLWGIFFLGFCKEL